MLTLSQPDLCKAFKISARSASLWCKGLPSVREGHSKRYKRVSYPRNVSIVLDDVAFE